MNTLRLIVARGAGRFALLVEDSPLLQFVKFADVRAFVLGLQARDPKAARALVLRLKGEGCEMLTSWLDDLGVLRAVADVLIVARRHRARFTRESKARRQRAAEDARDPDRELVAAFFAFRDDEGEECAA